MRTLAFTVFGMLVVLMIPTANAQERDRPLERREADFKPQNDRERALFAMIQQLRAEVANLKRQVAARGDGPRLSDDAYSRDRARTERREGDAPREGDRARERDPRIATNPMIQKATRIFAAYDKNKDKQVSFEEWLAMREGEMTEERKARERGFFAQPAGEDGVISLEEFVRAMQRRAGGDAPRERGPRDGETRERGPRDGETRERGPRDGETRERGPRDGEARERGPRDGEVGGR
jgi:hypothetical protein